MKDLLNAFIEQLLTNPFIIIVYIFIIIYLLYESYIIGWFGEHWTKKELTKLPKSEYTILNNIIIHSNNAYHQIDHIVVSGYGIFCIETKQYNGYITGNKYDKYWIRHFGKEIIRYMNPIRQNYGHVKSLSDVLDIEETKIFNIVCIPSRANLNIKHNGELTRNYTIVNKILSYRDIIIDNPDEIVKKLKALKNTNKKKKQEHINYIKKKIINKDSNTNICPKCGSGLKKKSGPYGAFIGCTNYPRCKYTEKL